MQKITTFLWFDTQAEEAAKYYTSIFPNSQITQVTRYGKEGPREEGLVMTVSFQLQGQDFIALNGGPEFTFNPSISLFVNCKDQAEVDGLWEKLIDGGESLHCGWVQDKFGLCWQIIPEQLMTLIGDPDEGRSQRAMKAMMEMDKIEIRVMEEAANAVSVS